MERKFMLGIPERLVSRYRKLMQASELDYDLLGIPRYETVDCWTVDCGDDYAIDLKVCSSDFGDPLWCEAVLFKDGCECSCTDVEDEITGEWELNADGISFMLHVASKEESNEYLG